MRDDIRLSKHAMMNSLMNILMGAFLCDCGALK